MPTAASILTKAARDVERLAKLQDDSAAARDLVASIRRHIRQWERLPDMPVPELQQLVDTKVLQRLATTCSSVSKAAPRSLAACAAFHVLAAFLSEVRQFLEAHKPTTTLSTLLTVLSISPTSDSSTAVLQSVRTQLLQSGLLGSMSAVLAAAAGDLRSQQLQQGHGAVRYRAEALQHERSLYLTALQHQLLVHCDFLLRVWDELCFFTDGEWMSQAAATTDAAGSSHEPDAMLRQQSQASRAASAPAAILLSAATVEVGDQHIRQLLATDRKAVLQVVQSSSSAANNPNLTWEAVKVFRFVKRALSVVSTVASYLPDTGTAAAGASGAAGLPEFTRLLTLSTFVSCQAALLQDRIASTAASSCSSVSGTAGSSSSSTGGVPASSTQRRTSAGQAITVRHLHAAHKALSACDTALLQMLGVSSEAAVWFAAMFTGSTSEVALRARRLFQALKASTAAAQQQVLAQQQLNQQLLLLVPAMLLRWAAQASGNPAAPNQVPRGLDALFAALSRIRLVGLCADIDGTIDTATDYVREWSQHVSSHRPAGANSSTTDSAVGAGSSMWLQPHLPAEWLQQVFPDIHTINSAREVAPATAPQVQMRAACPSKLVKFEAQSIAWAAQAGNQSDGTQPGTEVGGSTQTSQDQLQQQLQQGAASEASSTGISGSSSASISSSMLQPLPAALAAFQGVALQTIASFDGFVRSAAQHVAATKHAATQSVGVASACITGLCVSEDGSRPRPLLALVQAAGPGSREQQALYSCLRSIAKLATASIAAGGEPDLWRPQISTVAFAPALLLTLPVPEQTSQVSSATGGSSTQPPAPTATVYAPSLVLLGCALQFWADKPQNSAEPSEQLPKTEYEADGLATGSMETECFVQRVLDWLADSSVMQQLAAAGYAGQQLTATLQGLLAADAEADRSQGGEGCSETATAALRAAQEASGAALTALATPAFCNNPSCQNVSGPTELSLVSGRSCLCGGCCVARYCSRACQRAQWAQHKPVCKALVAAAAAAAGPAPAAAAGSVG